MFQFSLFRKHNAPRNCELACRRAAFLNLSCVVSFSEEIFLGKIAVKSEPIGARPGDGFTARRLAKRPLARGDGWNVSEVICSAGPHDRPFEERHSHVCIAIVMAGSFQYRSAVGRKMLTPGSLLLGNAGQYFECGHEHEVGDRCLSFAYEPQYFEGLAAEAGVPSRNMRFSTLRVPPVREFSGLIARACAGLAQEGGRRHKRSTFTAQAEKLSRDSFEGPRCSNAGTAKWEEIGIELAVRALGFAAGGSEPGNSLAAEARVARVVKLIESRPDLDHGLASLAREARLSRYHFLRVFRQITGRTPHQYVLRARLRRAAARLILESAQVLDIALDSGFGDVSNFNHAFHAEFGISPRLYRRNLQCK
jgi:AraC family transcriptional regulator